MNEIIPAVETPTQGAPVKYRLPPIHPEGIKFAVLAGAITLLMFLLDWSWLGWIFLIFTLWVIAFFRDPLRVTPHGADLIVSPADGLVCQIAEVEMPRELVTGEAAMNVGKALRVSIFMSVFDVHVNRSPIAGRISKVVYVPGKFVNADLDKASVDNERQYFVVDGENGVRIAFTQIAGLVARRILRFVQVGNRVTAGERVGLIRFGSRVDVFLPEGTAAKVALGQRAIAGETILGVLGDSRPVLGSGQ